MSLMPRGADFEKRVFGLFESEIKGNRFLAKPECCAIFHKKAYYSRDRSSNIIFDVAIELTLPGADRPSALWLVECKHYNHPVPVDDVEEFFSKVQQVAAANSKAVLATSNSFQRGAREFARAKGIGLLRVFPASDFKWVLHRSPHSVQPAGESLHTGAWKAIADETFHSTRFDAAGSIGDLTTFSLFEFFRELAADVIDSNSIAEVTPFRNDRDVLPFINAEGIEQQCRGVHSKIGYKAGSVSLEAVCEWQKLETGLIVKTGDASILEVGGRILGRISFDPLAITVYSDSTDKRRQRFTLAHELGHLILGHGARLKTETVDDKDIESSDGDPFDEDEIRRIEWQANHFASCLLLPRDAFITSTLKLARKMDLKDHGHGLIYLDHQLVNKTNYRILTSDLMGEYEASQTAVKIRLKSLGLLHESQVWNGKTSTLHYDRRKTN